MVRPTQHGSSAGSGPQFLDKPPLHRRHFQIGAAFYAMPISVDYEVSEGAVISEWRPLVGALRINRDQVRLNPTASAQESVEVDNASRSPEGPFRTRGRTV